MTSQNDVFTVGAGYLDVKAALANTDVAAGTALSPIAVFDSAAGSAYLLGDSGAIWGGTATWNMSAVWGSSAVWGGRTLTGRTTIWGTAAVWGNAAVWGGGSSYGFSAVWGSSAVWGGVRARDAVIDALNVEIDGEN